jgi:hypothetical protein
VLFVCVAGLLVTPVQAAKAKYKTSHKVTGHKSAHYKGKRVSGHKSKGYKSNARAQRRSRTATR